MSDKINMLLWVTSECNLSCRWCITRYPMKLLKGYEMSLAEVENFISSSKRRNIHYFAVTFSGGEPTMWKYLKEATRMIYESGITDRIELVSNGTNPNKIFKISSMLYAYAISATQCTGEQLRSYYRSGEAMVINDKPHKKPLTEPLDDVLPAECCNKTDFMGDENNVLNYIDGKVYYCCNAIIQSEYTGLTEDLVCDFEDNFIDKFSGKAYDKLICRYCLCNNKVWEKVK